MLFPKNIPYMSDLSAVLQVITMEAGGYLRVAIFIQPMPHSRVLFVTSLQLHIAEVGDKPQNIIQTCRIMSQFSF